MAIKTKKTVSRDLIKQAIVSAQSKTHVGSAHTKTRGEVSGGGRKPWKQKGTGRARAGSSRSPIWRGGGITFGPRSNNNKVVNLPKKMVKAARRGLLELIKENKQIQTTKSLHINETKTKEAKQMLAAFNLTGKNTLLVTKQVEAELIIATHNLPGVVVRTSDNLSVLDLASVNQVIMEDAVYEQFYGEVKEAKKVTAETKAKKVAAKKSTETTEETK